MRNRLKTLKRIFGKTDGTQPQSGSSPVPQGPAGATAEGTAPTGEKPTKKCSRKPRIPCADSEPGAPRTVEKTEKGEKPAKPATKEGRGVKPHGDKPRRERKPKPVGNWKLEDFVVEPQEDRTRSHDFNFAPNLMHAIHDLGLPYCTPIQAQVLGFTLRSQNAIDRAQTDTGKTAAFLISVITQLLQTPSPGERYVGEPRTLIIVPTREPVVQIVKDAAVLTKHAGLNVMTFVSGMDFDKQLEQLEARFCDVLVATPGRLLDLGQRGGVHLDMVEVVVLDEADRMLDIGFILQVWQIIRQTPHKGERQTLLFLVTFTDDAMNLVKQWIVDPAIIEIGPENIASDTVEQYVYVVAGSDKYELLYNLVAQNNWERVMVFANRKGEVRRTEECLTEDGVSAAQMSGDMSWHKRTRTLEGFHEGKIRVLVATDAAGRGTHIDGISHVINFVLPEDLDDYVHRIGRAGRAGASGTSIGFVDEDDAFVLPPIKELLGRKITYEIPSAELLKPALRKH